MKFELNEYHRNISDNDLLEDLQKVVKENNISLLTMEVYKKFGKYSKDTITRRFGSWSNALKKAGIKPDRKQIQKMDISRETIIQDIKNIYQKFGTINCKIYDKESKIGFKRVLNEFEYWETALKEAGIPLNGGSKHITNEDLFGEIERLWVTLCRQPSSNDIRQGLSKYSLNTYCRRFGSWRATLQNFVNYINNGQEFLYKQTPCQHISEQTKQIIKDKHTTKRDINLRLRFLVMKRDNFKCCKCGRSPANTTNLELHIDHIKPYSKGGETVIENLQTLCSDCNLGKSDLE